MAEFEQGANRGSNDSSGRNNNGKAAPHRPIQGVDFDEMNFEQRRAPYNSGNRTLSEKEYDRSAKKNNNPPSRRNDV